MIYLLGQMTRPARPPGPDLGSDIVDQGYARAGQAFGQAKGKPRGIDGNQCSRTDRLDVRRRFAQTAQQQGHARKNLSQPHN